MDLFEYQGKQLFARYGIPVSDGEAGRHRRRRGRGGRTHRLPGGGEGPGAGGRAGQGGRHQARRQRRRGPQPTPAPSSAWTSRATSSRWCGSSAPATSPRSTTRRSRSTARRSCTSACSPRRAASRSSRSPRRTPTRIARIHVDPVDGLTEAQCREWVAAAKLNPAATEGAVDILLKLYQAYVDGDADLVEINPLILTPDGRVHALDAKVTLDDNARSATRTRPSTTRPRCATHARRPRTSKGLQYVGLDG